MEKLTARVSLKLPPDLKLKIEELGRKEQRSVNFLGIQAFLLLLKQHRANAKNPHSSESGPKPTR